MPSYNRDSGEWGGDVRIDFAYGNMPMQPSDDRDGDYLGTMDSHEIALTEWNSYPEFASAANYMITGFEFLGDVLYECTSQNNLKVGDEVVIRDIDWYEGPVTRTVVYADANRFQFLDEAGYPPKLTGLHGRADVVNDSTGRTLEGGNTFLYPSMGFCYNDPRSREGKVEALIETLVACGVDPELLVDATFEGGEDKYDSSGEYVGGAIFYEYIPANAVIFYDLQDGYRVTGADLEGSVFATGWTAGDLVDLGEDALYYSFVVVSNNPNKNNSGWWY